jgi:hypothetical protein
MAGLTFAWDCPASVLAAFVSDVIHGQLSRERSGAAASRGT